MQLRVTDVPKGWSVWHDGQGTVHIFPNDDIIDHEQSDECICGPAFELRQFEPPEGYFQMSKQEQDRIDHRDGHIHTHHALDGRA